MQVQTFIAALCALSRREVQYGAYATSEEVCSTIFVFQCVILKMSTVLSKSGITGLTLLFSNRFPLIDVVIN